MTAIVDVSAAEYHADQFDNRPSLSASIASLLVNRSPLHAWTAHPRLNPDARRVDKDTFDVGNVAHQLFLEGQSSVQVVDAADWRTKDAKEQRDEARAAGRVPLLVNQYAEVCRMVDAIHDQLERHAARPRLFTDGKPEQTVVWEDEGVLCRMRADWLRDDFLFIDDLKTTSRSANPDAFARRLYEIGCDVQAAMYVRGIEAVTGVRPEFRWCVVETAPPYALSVVSPGADVLTIGRKKVEYALKVWRHCLERDRWAGYPLDVVEAELPISEEARWLAREVREEIAA